MPSDRWSRAEEAAMSEKLAREAEVLESQVRAALRPDQWHLVELLVEARGEVESNRSVQTQYAMAEGIAHHLPGLAPAIVALGDHVWENRTEMDDSCGLVDREGFPGRVTNPWCREILRPVAEGEA
jgi:hypothetical protein